MGKEFNLYNQYKKKWILPLIFSVVASLSITCCILFSFVIECGICYDISISIFTGTIVFSLTQLLLYLNKRPKLQIQKDAEISLGLKYKLGNIKDRISKLALIDNEQDYIELLKIMQEFYNMLYKNSKVLDRISKILAKRVDYYIWAYIFFIDKHLSKIDFKNFFDNITKELGIKEITIKYGEVKEYLNDKIDTIYAQITELNNDFQLFYNNEKNKIADEIF